MWTKLKLHWRDSIAVFPLFFFITSTISFWGQAPSLDPMVVYRESTQFFSGGLSEIINSGTHTHPPLLYILTSLGFLLFGKSPLSYTLVGVLLFLCMSILTYFFLKKYFGVKIAIPLHLLLFCNPIIIINSVYLTNDLIILYGIMIAFMFYLTKKYIWLAITLGVMILMKETALIVVTAFLLYISLSILLSKKSRMRKNNELRRLLLVAFPSLATFLLWNLYLRFLGTTEWRDMSFVSSQDSSYMIVLKNIGSLHFFNIFLFQNLRNAFILNFQWIYTGLTIVLGMIMGKKAWHHKKEREGMVLLLVIGIFYIVFVFSFPTWTEIRYAIPLLFSLFLLLSFFLSHIKNTFLYVGILCLLVVLTIVSNFFSIDPVSLHYGKISIHHKLFYNLPFWNSGPDRIVYNLEFLPLVTNQNSLISNVINTHSDVLITDCSQLKIGEKIYSLTIHNNFYPALKLTKSIVCIDTLSINHPQTKYLLQNKRLYFHKNESVFILPGK